jgi:hypothetical protein
MTESPSSLDGFLAEFKATLSQPSGEAILRRINAERLLSLIAEEFIESHQADRIRVLADNQVVGQSGADFLLQIDDYDIRLEFLDAPGGEPYLDQDLLPQLASLLKDNPSTIAVVMVWTTDDLQALALSSEDIQGISESKDRIRDLLTRARPLAEVLRGIVDSQTRLWDVNLKHVEPTAAKPFEMRRMFEQAIGRAIDAERGRSYRFAERKLAAQQFPVEQEKRLIFSVLADALDEGSTQELVTRLTRLPRRGGK